MNYKNNDNILYSIIFSPTFVNNNIVYSYFVNELYIFIKLLFVIIVMKVLTQKTIICVKGGYC